MRLTLRTLLSYLDDTLEPAQAKLMGEKVAESDIAPELISRISKVTRRRGLAAPAITGDRADSSTDPNTVAEYLDNSLPAEQIEEVERAAIESDAILAEVSACHQILTMVLGEPARVPPTARRRMYCVVKGPESIPSRKASTAQSVAGMAEPASFEDDNAEADEALLLGMRGRRSLVPIASALVLVGLLVFVIWMAIPGSKPGGSQGYFAVATSRAEGETKVPPVVVSKKEIKKPDTEPKKTDIVEKAKEETLPKKVEPEKLLADQPELLPDPRKRRLARLPCRRKNQTLNVAQLLDCKRKINCCFSATAIRANGNGHPHQKIFFRTIRC